MMPPRSAALLAGQVLAHAAWSISDLGEGEILVPLAGVLRDGELQFIRFMSEDVSEALVAFGRRQLVDQQRGLEAWTLAYDTRLMIGDDKVDAILFEVWGKSMATPTVFAQIYQPFHAGVFRLLGEPLYLGSEAEGSSEDLANTLATFREGVERHDHVAALWDTWLQEGMRDT